ncbi:MAG: archaemetzincin family Zn-dependent metalloprotease [Thermodesulfobacteriota bacterium]
MISAPGHIVVITPIGNFSSAMLSAVSLEIQRIFGFSVRIQSLLPNVSFAYDLDRDQYNSTMILQKLDAAAPPEAAKVLGITEVDLFIPILTYVYGEAQLGGKACIVSIHRLSEGISPVNTEAKFVERITKEAIHELGHTFNLRHCPDHACSMHYCRCIADVDNKSDQLCRYCKILLEDAIKKIHPPNP